MAKVYFQNMNKETVATINQISEARFVMAEEIKRLSNERKSIKKRYEEAVAAENEADRKTAEAELRVNQDKGKAVRIWYKEQLFDHKDSAGNEFKGLFTALGLTTDFYQVYVDMVNESKFSPYFDAIKSMLADFGMGDLKNRLVSAVAHALDHCGGVAKISDADFRKGVYLKEEKQNVFFDKFFCTLLAYVSDTCPDIVTYTSKTASVIVTYDKNLVFESYKVGEVEDTEKADK